MAETIERAMTELTAEQRNYYYLLEAARTGIHKPILAALYVAHYNPNLTDGEVGLGIAPINRIPPDHVNTFPEQVQYAANTIRSITNRLTAQGWEGGELWNVEQGRYSDRFIKEVADGYTPPANDPTAALLETSDYETLLHSYLEDIAVDHHASRLPEDLAFLDPTLLEFIEEVPRYYQNLPYQRTALLEATRLWRKLDTTDEAIAAFNVSTSSLATGESVDEGFLDPVLLQFIQTVPPYYAGYPHQREALLRLVQLWRQLNSREDAIALLQTADHEQNEFESVDSALIAFIQRLPQLYQSKGEQRNALTETFRLWHSLDSRSTVLAELGINPQMLTSANPDRTLITNAARQLDRALIEFVKRVPAIYQETEPQREALIRLVQLWRGLPGREGAIQSLLDDLRRMERARRDSPDAPPLPLPMTLLARPAQWTPTNIQLYASIIPNGNFIWAEATHGGMQMPPNQATVDAIVRIAQLAQHARDRIGRSFRVISWYRSPDISHREGISYSRHVVGDAIVFYCDGLTGNQVYWALDPWWTGGLGRYHNFPNLIHLDARGYRARWTH
ncbi:MAG: D-Ala-D-Ala carboxypeptidase family metallohydrolase [Oculatellaceae cyanobacterium bins.114]|nr:D-Ala-D-Ala carboxypeptidase family metallohydrolase [Oculatellaceae cyanobacterium bins.114]